MTTYTINLEDVDVLPLLATQSNNFLKKEYFEFQVIAVEEPIQPIGTYETYTCYICDIQVPVSFVNEHTLSIKHIANTKIASEAASRLKSLVLAPPPSPSTNEPTAFCANCSLLVDRNHENTGEHTAAVNKDKQLWDLMNVYVKNTNDSKGKDNVVDNKKDSNDAEIAIDNTPINGKDKLEWDVKNNISATKVLTSKQSAVDKKNDSNDAETAIDNTAINGKDKPQWDLMNDYVNENDINASKGFDGQNSVVDKKKESNEAETIDHTAIKKAPSKVSNKQTVPTSSRGFKSFTKAKNIDEDGITRENYAEQLREIYEDSYIELLYKVNNNDSEYRLQESGTEILIYKGNEVVHVPGNHFHGFVCTLNHVTCVLCKAHFHQDYAHIHKYEMIHLNKLMTSYVADYVRKLQFGTRHCIICNLKLKRKQVDLHVKSRQHIENKNLYTKTVKQQEETENTDCDTTIKLSNTEAVAETWKNDVEDESNNILESPAECVRDINSNDTEQRKTANTINKDVTDNITVNKEGNVTDNSERVLITDVPRAKTDVEIEENPDSDTEKLIKRIVRKIANTINNDVTDNITVNKEGNVTDNSERVLITDVARAKTDVEIEENPDSDTEKLIKRIVRKIANTFNNDVTVNITVNKEGNVTDNGERVLITDVARAATDVDVDNAIIDDKHNSFEHAAVRYNEIGRIEQTVVNQAVEKYSDSEILCMFKKASDKRAICTFCECKLPNTLKCMRAHVRGRKHMRTMDRVNSLSKYKL